ncbi:ABC transporter permease [Natronosalvus rutilus]|uniref:ABC transporter permease n=1 Tax=Natronosalvus rutilus TaxID=2953753 RepID=A0A9E7N747_9EURY|nr:ABC transporter permease [Natronosalvus rutilus]UTF52937.1 ABC transporter permease [Natronosalvus rutilus]
MSHDQDTDELKTIRERIAANPRPAAIWAAVLGVLLLLEIGRIGAGIVKLGGVVRLILGGLAAIPHWVHGNIQPSAGLIAAEIGFVITALLVLSVATILLRATIVTGPLAERFGFHYDRFDSPYVTEERLDRGLLLAVLTAVTFVVTMTPAAVAIDLVVGAFTSFFEWVASLGAVTSPETIPNQGYRSPDGSGWEGTFMGLSPAWAWALRVAVVYVYAFVTFAWLWKGYTIFREHYREADWTPRDDSINRFRNHYWGIFGLIVVFMFVVMALWAPALGPVGPQENIYSPYGHEFQYLNSESGELETVSHGTANIDSRSQGSDPVSPMSYDNYDRWSPFGTTANGKNLFTYLVFGARTSLVIGITAIGLATGIALGLSLLTAYYKGLVDLVTVIVSDTVIAVPVFLAVLLLSVVFQESNHPIASYYNGGLLLALIFAGLYWPGLWRSIRGPSLQVAEQEWVDAAKSYGQTPMMTMRKHMAPYIFSYVMIYASLLLGGVIIVTAALSFLGLGINPPTPEWGRIISDGRSYVSTESWHIATIPGILIVLVVTGFNALGDGIRDAMDPESESGEGDVTTTGGGA